jgi:hypothetical protein
MATSLTILQARITSELVMLGTFTSEVQQNIIRDAVMRFVRKADLPVISATMAVTASSTGAYSIPSTIEKITRIYNNASTPAIVNFITDLTKRTVTLTTAPSTTGNYDVRGTAREIRTNLSTVIAALTEDHEDVVWEYIRAFAMRQSGAMEAYRLELQAADKAVSEMRKSINRNMDQNTQTVNFIDTTGQIIADSSNAEGLTPDISDHLESDL